MSRQNSGGPPRKSSIPFSGEGIHPLEPIISNDPPRNHELGQVYPDPGWGQSPTRGQSSQGQGAGDRRSTASEYGYAV
jgi:hypothetical protein